MSRSAWDEGYNEVISAITQAREMTPNPYIEGTRAADLWDDGVSAAWDDECRPVLGSLE